MRKIITVLLILCTLLCLAFPAAAAEGRVTYSGNSGEFIFAPGSKESPTDLFPDFKDLMPGDSVTQKLTVKNDADKEVKVDIYIRSLGAKEGSEEFLSQMRLKVAKSVDNKMEYMFDAAADQSAQLTDWVLLGTLYSGGEVNLDITLEVPVEMGNEFQSSAGYIDWDFKVEELPVDPDDPKPPQTGDDLDLGLILALVAVTAFIIFIFLLRRKRETHEEKEETAHAQN